MRWDLRDAAVSLQGVTDDQPAIPPMHEPYPDVQQISTLVTSNAVISVHQIDYCPGEDNRHDEQL